MQFQSLIYFRNKGVDYSIKVESEVPIVDRVIEEIAKRNIKENCSSQVINTKGFHIEVKEIKVSSSQLFIENILITGDFITGEKQNQGWFNYLTGSPEAPFSLEELAFGVQIFRNGLKNFDGLVGREESKLFKPLLTYQLSLQICLKIWGNFFKEIGEENKILEELSKKETFILEAIRTYDPETIDKAAVELTKKVRLSLKKEKEAYVPSGMAISGSLSTFAIYKLYKKEEDDAIYIQSYSVNGLEDTTASWKIKSENLEIFLRSLVYSRIDIPDLKVKKALLHARLPSQIEIAMDAASVTPYLLKYKALIEKKMDVPSDIEEAFSEKNAAEAETKTASRQYAAAEKLVEIFLKGNGALKTKFSKDKYLLKTAFFFYLFKKGKSFLPQNIPFRKWMTENVTALALSLKNSALDQEEEAFLKERFLEIKEHLECIERRFSYGLPESLPELPPLAEEIVLENTFSLENLSPQQALDEVEEKSHFLESFLPASISEEISALKQELKQVASSSSSSKNAKPDGEIFYEEISLEGVDFFAELEALERKEPLTIARTAILAKCLEEKMQKGQFREVDLFIRIFFEEVSRLEKEDFFKELSEEEALKWAFQMEKWATIILRNQWGMQQLSSPPSYRFFLIQLLKISEDLFVYTKGADEEREKAFENIFFSGENRYRVDTFFIKHTLTNPDLSLGIYGKPISQLINTLEETKDSPLRALGNEVRDIRCYPFSLQKRWNELEALADLKDALLSEENPSHPVFKDFYSYHADLKKHTLFLHFRNVNAFLIVGLEPLLSLESTFSFELEYRTGFLLSPALFRLEVEYQLDDGPNNYRFSEVSRKKILFSIFKKDLFKKAKQKTLSLTQSGHYLGNLEIDCKKQGAVLSGHWDMPRLENMNGMDVYLKTPLEESFISPPNNIYEELFIHRPDFVFYEQPEEAFQRIISLGGDVLSIATSHLQDRIKAVKGIPKDVLFDFFASKVDDNSRLSLILGVIAKHAFYFNDPLYGKALRDSVEATLFQFVHAALLRNVSYEAALLRNGSYEIETSHMPLSMCDPLLQLQFTKVLQETAHKMEENHAFQSFIFLKDLEIQLSFYFQSPQETNALLHKWEEKILSLLNMSEEKISSLAPFREEFQLAFLILGVRTRENRRREGKESLPASEKTALLHLKYSVLLKDSFFIYKNIRKDLFREIESLLFSERREMNSAFQNEALRNAFCNDIFEALEGNSSFSPKEWKEDSSENRPLFFRAGIFSLDLKNGILWKEGKRTGKMPEQVFREISFQNFLEETSQVFLPLDLPKLKVTQHLIEQGERKGVSYSFMLHKREGGKVSFKLVYLDGVTLFKQEGDQWYRYQEKIEQKNLLNRGGDSVVETLYKAIDQARELFKGETEGLPVDVFECRAWVSEDKKAIILEKKGRVCYRLKMQGEKIVSCKTANGLEVINPWKLKEYAYFKQLANRRDIVCSFSAASQEIEIKYPLLGLTYERHLGQPWQVRGFSDHHLTAEKCPLFSPSFSYYHFLKGKEGVPDKVILHGDLYIPNFLEMDLSDVMKVVPLEEMGIKKTASSKKAKEKDAYSLVPAYTNTLGKKGVELVAHFFGERRVNLKNPELYIFDIDLEKGFYTENSLMGYFYLSYVLAIQGKTVEAFYYLEKILLPRGELPVDLENLIQAIYLTPLKGNFLAFQVKVALFERTFKETLSESAKKILKKYQENGAKLPLELQLSEKERQEVDLLLLEDAQEEVSYALREIAEIKALRKAKKVEIETREIPLYPSFQRFLKKKDQKRREGSEVPSPEFSLEDPYEKAIATARITDLEYVKNGEEVASYEITHSAHLKTSLEQEKGDLTQALSSVKNDILSSIPFEKGNADPFLETFIQRRLQWQDFVFKNLLNALGEGNLEEAILSLYKDADKKFIEGIEEKLIEFLKKSIQRQGIEKALKIMATFSGKEKETKEMAALLSSTWKYSVEEHPLRGTFLLLEYELGLLLRKNQIEGAVAILNNPFQFKQEICGGGKTTVLRNLVTHNWADGATLATVSTGAALRGTHGPLLEKTSLHAFGQRVFPFYFDRKTRVDKTFLSQLYQQFIRTTRERGRCEISMGDILKFKHAETETREKALRKSLEVTHEEIDLFENIRDFWEENMQVIADEVDADCNALEEVDYAVGAVSGFNEIQLEAALEVLLLILKEPSLASLKKAIQENKQDNFTEKELEEFLFQITHLIFQRERENLHLKKEEEALLRDYLLDRGDLAVSTAFFEEKIKGKQEKISFFKQLLAQTLLPSLKLKGGVDYGRSENKITTIPYAGSDKPKEGSEYSSQMRQIWFTCLDYVQLRSGIDEGSISFLVEKSKRQARQEMQNILESGVEVSFEETPTARKFEKTFKRALLHTSFKEYGEIAKILKQDEDSLVSFLKEWVFPTYQLRKEKIVGKGVDAIAMMKSYSGFSGTEEGKYALPAPMDITDSTQPGSYGKIFYVLLESERTSYNSFIFYKNEEELFKTLLEGIKGGDCLSDGGAAFPGVSAFEIAAHLSRAKPDLYFRFLNRQDEWKMCKNGVEIALDEKIPLEEVFTLFDHPHTRGAERPSQEGVTEFITIGKNTRLTDFEQAVSRERKVLDGKAQVMYVLAEEMRGEVLNLASLYTLLIKNEVLHLRKLNYKAEKDRLSAIVPEAIDRARREITKENRAQGEKGHYKAREVIDKAIRHYFIKQTFETADSIGAPVGLIEAEKALDHLKKQETDKLKNLLKNIQRQKNYVKEEDKPYLESFLKKLQKTLSLLEGPRKVEKMHIPEKVFSVEEDSSIASVEVEQEEEVDQSVSVDVEVDIEMDMGNNKPTSPIYYEGMNFTIHDLKNLVEGKVLFNSQIQSFRPFYFILKAGYAARAISIKDAFSKKDLLAVLPEEFFSVSTLLDLMEDGDSVQISQPTNSARKSGKPTAEVIRRQSVSFQLPTKFYIGSPTPWTLLSENNNQLRLDQERIYRSLFVIHLKRKEVVEIIFPILEADYVEAILVRAKKYGFSQAPDILFSTYNYSLNALDGGDEWEGISEEIANKIRKQIVTTKFQAGDVFYPDLRESFKKHPPKTPKDSLRNLYPSLVEWLKECENPYEMERSFKVYLKKYRPSEVYKGSSLEKAFKEVYRGTLQIEELSAPLSEIDTEEEKILIKHFGQSIPAFNEWKKASADLETKIEKIPGFKEAIYEQIEALIEDEGGIENKEEEALVLKVVMYKFLEPLLEKIKDEQGLESFLDTLFLGTLSLEKASRKLIDTLFPEENLLEGTPLSNRMRNNLINKIKEILTPVFSRDKELALASFTETQAFSYALREVAESTKTFKEEEVLKKVSDFLRSKTPSSLEKSFFKNITTGRLEKFIEVWSDKAKGNEWLIKKMRALRKSGDSATEYTSEVLKKEIEETVKGEIKKRVEAKVENKILRFFLSPFLALYSWWLQRKALKGMETLFTALEKERKPFLYTCLYFAVDALENPSKAIKKHPVFDINFIENFFKLITN